jgi:hypothetical protein
MKTEANELEWDPLGCGKDIVYCDNPYCESPAFETVSVSEESAGDSTRNYCAPCAEAYTVGVQHGTFRTLADLREAQREPAPKRQRCGKKDLDR